MKVQRFFVGAQYIAPLRMGLALILLAGWLGMIVPTGHAQAVDRHTLLDHIANEIIWPAHQAFYQTVLDLQTSIHALQADPTEANLLAVQAAWEQAAYAFSQCELFTSQRLMLLHNQISKWEVNTHFIENFIAGEEVLDGAFIERIGSTAKGLPALEYLLFIPQAEPAAILQPLTDDPRRMAYLVALAENLVSKTEELLAVWSPEGQDLLADFIAADGAGADTQSTLSKLTNQLVMYLDDILNRQLEIPLGRNTNGTVVPETLWAWRSGFSAQLILSRLALFETLLNEGLGDYLIALGATELPAAITDQLQAIRDTIATFDEPFDHLLQTSPNQLRTLSERIRRLFILVRVDMVSWLGVNLTFVDRDGD